MKNYVFVEVSEFEALQRNFLDYHKSSLKNILNKNKFKEIQEAVKQIIFWYVFTFGDVQIFPEIFSLLDINPFEKLLDGRNIFHFLCESNSYSSLKTILDYLYDQCHDRKHYPTRESYKDWDIKSLNSTKYKKFVENLNIESDEGKNTPAHMCVIYKSFNCLELLLKYNINIDVNNLRGRSVRELMYANDKYSISGSAVLSPQYISAKYIKLIKE